MQGKEEYLALFEVGYLDAFDDKKKNGGIVGRVKLDLSIAQLWY